MKVRTFMSLFFTLVLLGGNLYAGKVLEPGEHVITDRGQQTIRLENEMLFKTISKEEKAIYKLWKDRKHFIQIIPNTEFGGGSTFYLKNTKKNERIRVNIYAMPSETSEYTEKIFHLDPADGNIVLRKIGGEESRWEVEEKDRSILYEWDEGDLVVIGHNENWYASFLSDCKFVMINCNKEGSILYVRVRPN